MIGGTEFPFPLARRLKRFRISDHGLVMLFERGQVWGVREGIPEGARAVGIQLDQALNCVIVYAEHPTFPYINDGHPIPEGRILFADVREDLREWKNA